MNKFNEYLNNYVSGKNVCILGFGREGKSTYKLIDKYCSCSSITIADVNQIDRMANSLPDKVKTICGETYQDSLGNFDIVFKSPGIVLKTDASELDCEITCETQVFFEFFRRQIVGITGTKGKSTCSSLIFHILSESGCDCRLAGNIGIPVFDIAESITDNTIIVCELSCHQLEYMTVSPHIAVMLNLYEEHLDHYGTMEKYAAAKQNIYLNQQADDILFCNSDILPNNARPLVKSISASTPEADIYVSDGIIRCGNDEYEIPTDKIHLLGVHNHYNIAIAYAVCKMLNISENSFTAALCKFNPLAHRLEYVGTADGVSYYDDSISTACATAIEAVKSVPNPGTILIGGMDRGIDYTELIDFLDSTDINVICMEHSGKRIFDIIMSGSFRNPDRVHYAAHLDEAVKFAHQITKKGQSCILSPASASYGIFRNFEERGDAFKELVAGLKKEESMQDEQ